MKISIVPFILASAHVVFGGQATGASEDAKDLELLTIKRIYVAPFSGGAHSAQLRDLIIASLAATKLFILTEKEDRADAVLKGAADDNTFTDTFDYQDSESVRDTVGLRSGSGTYGSSSGIYGGIAAADSESHHSKERKHEAYATVRLCDKNGDVVWSTTQESLGAKFKGASADVAAKVARQITLEYGRAQRSEDPPVPTPAAAPPKK